MDAPRELFAEFLGVCMLTTFGSLQPHGSAGNGLLYAVMIYITAKESLGHLNPAVTLGFIATERMELLKGLQYIAAQVLGGIFGAVLAAGMVGTLPFLGHGPGCVAASVGWLQIILWEMLMTFFLVATVFMVAVHPDARAGYGPVVPIVIGLALFAAAATGDKYTSSFINPARVIGPSLVFLCSWKIGWAYLIGQALGASLGAGVTYHVFIKPREPLYARLTDGALSPEFAEDFEAYADALFRAFPRIKNWMTFNEPYVTCHFGYGVGSFAPGYKGGDAANMACVRNVLLAHGRAKRLSRTRYSRLGHRIGIALNIEWAEPFTQSSEDKAAAQRAIDLQFGAYADPLFLGRFPPLLKSKFGPAVKDFTPEEAALVKGSLDFLGINHYTANYVHANGDPLGFTYSPKSKDGVFIGPVAQSSWLRVYPDGIYKSVLYASKRYGWPEIWLTENGVSVPGEADMPVGQAVQDAFRVNYYRDYLNKLCRAKRDGVRVARYYAWSLLDNFEWVQGYTERFGITHVDFNTQKRTVKDSGRYLSEHFFKANS